MSNDYLTEVLEKLEDNPTSAELDFFLEAFARVGYLASVAQGKSERAEQDRRLAEAMEYADARAKGAKSSADAERIAIVRTNNQRVAEIGARESAAKLKHLLNSIEQTINGIKYLGRQTDVPMTLPGSTPRR